MVNQKSLYDLFPCDELNLQEFWRQVDLLPHPKRYKHRRSQALKLRFNRDGSVARTYSEMADVFGLKSGERARQILSNAIRCMRHHTRIHKFCTRNTA